MKIKTSITLSEEVLKEVDKLSSRYGNRSVLIEQAIREFLAAGEKRRRDLQDVDHDHLMANLEQWRKTTLKGFSVLGSNGESVLLRTEEKVETWRTGRPSPSFYRMCPDSPPVSASPGSRRPWI